MTTLRKRRFRWNVPPLCILININTAPCLGRRWHGGHFPRSRGESRAQGGSCRVLAPPALRRCGALSSSAVSDGWRGLSGRSLDPKRNLPAIPSSSGDDHKRTCPSPRSGPPNVPPRILLGEQAHLGVGLSFTGGRVRQVGTRCSLPLLCDGLRPVRPRAAPHGKAKQWGPAPGASASPSCSPLGLFFSYAF